jgi:hypothetical protein
MFLPWFIVLLCTSVNSASVRWNDDATHSNGRTSELVAKSSETKANATDSAGIPDRFVLSGVVVPCPTLGVDSKDVVRVNFGSNTSPACIDTAVRSAPGADPILWLVQAIDEDVVGDKTRYVAPGTSFPSLFRC